MVWTIGLGLIALALFSAWHLLLNRKEGATLDHYGLRWQGQFKAGQIVRSFLLALGVLSVAYLSLLLTLFFFDVDYRIWVFGIKPLTLLQFQIALSYVVPFCAFFLVVALLLHGQLRQAHWSFARELAVNWVLLVGGYLDRRGQSGHALRLLSIDRPATLTNIGWRPRHEVHCTSCLFLSGQLTGNGSD